MLKHYLSYYGIRLIGWPLSLLSYRQLHRVGRLMARVGWACIPATRKRVLNNLALVKNPSFSFDERWQIGRESLANLIITCLDYLKLKQSKERLEEIIVCSNPEVIEKIHQAGYGLVFFEGHQANWEVPFLYASARIPGTAVGRPIKNPRLYRWLLSLREMMDGKIVIPKNAMQAGLSALKEGRFMGFVGDQALPTSSYSYPLFGMRAWTTTAPALLAYKASCPIVVGMTHREGDKYHLRFGEPIWPDTTQPLKTNVIQMMNEAMRQLEESIIERPGEWLWLHNRWKQIGITNIHRRFRHDILLVILPDDGGYDDAAKIIAPIAAIYDRASITVRIPQGREPPPALPHVEIVPYSTDADLFEDDWRTQMLFNFSLNKKIEKHYRRRSVFEVMDRARLKKEAVGCANDADIETLLYHTLLKDPNKRPASCP